MPTNTCFEMKAADYAYLRTLPGNDVCIDCGAKKPDWGTPSFGILFCFQCSGRHRGLGTHISFVRSVTMDAWTEKQIKFMKAGGNQKCKDFLQERGVNMSISTPIRQKYDNPAAQSYKLMLKAQVEEGSTKSTTNPAAAAPPSTKTEFPKQSQTEPEEAAGVVATTQYTPPPTASAALLAAPAAVPHLGAAPVQPPPPLATKKLKKKMEGFGNTPPPPPPNEGLKNLALVAVPLAVVAVGWFLVSH